MWYVHVHIWLIKVDYTCIMRTWTLVSNEYQNLACTCMLLFEHFFSGLWCVANHREGLPNHVLYLSSVFF